MGQNLHIGIRVTGGVSLYNSLLLRMIEKVYNKIANESIRT